MPEVRPDRLKLDFAQRSDGWSNVASGLGTIKDKRTYTKYKTDFLLDKETLASAYVGDGLVKRIINCMPQDAMREWGHLNEEKNLKKKKKKNVIEAEMQRLGAMSVFSEALQMSRLMGGSILFIGATGAGSIESPLVATNIKNIEYLKVFDLGDILTNECVFDEDMNSPNFGKIKLYKVKVRTGVMVDYKMIHYTRCIPFYGMKVPASSNSMANSVEIRYWGTSVLQYIMNDLADFRGVFGNVATILNEFIIGKYKFSDLDEILSSGNEKALQTRVMAIEMTKSSINSVLLGTDEEYTRDSASVGGISDLLDRFMMIMSAVTGIPVTKLFGRSPAGMNATGENDLKNYYDECRSIQNDLTVPIENFCKIIGDWKKSKGDIDWNWNPLFQLSRKDLADIERVEAETKRTLSDADQRYLTEGVLMPEEVYGMRFEEELGAKDASLFVLPDVQETNNDPNLEMSNEPPKKEEVKNV